MKYPCVEKKTSCIERIGLFLLALLLLLGFWLLFKSNETQKTIEEKFEELSHLECIDWVCKNGTPSCREYLYKGPPL
jgi:hypothetical protein